MPGSRAGWRDPTTSPILRHLACAPRRFAGFYGEADTEEKKKEECAAMAKHVKVVSVQPGHVFAPADTPNGEFVMLYQGTMKRTRHDAIGGASETQVFKPGGYAGGISMLRPDKTVEHVVAESACLVLVASSSDFFSLLELLPVLSAQLMIKAFQKQSPLSALLAYPKSFELFLAHQKEEFASESSEFWQDSEAFVAAAKRGAASEELKTMADELVSMYIVEGSERQINVPSDQAKAVVAAAQTAEVPATLFDKARTEIYNLMKRDTLPRFVQGTRFEELLTSLGEPSPIPSCDVPLTLAAASTALAARLGGQGSEAKYDANYP